MSRFKLLPQSSNVSRWCKDNQPAIKIILLTVRQESEVTKVEQRWADRQGALCILPKLDRQNLQSQFSQIYEYLNLELPVINLVAPTPVLDLVDITQRLFEKFWGYSDSDNNRIFYAFAFFLLCHRWAESSVFRGCLNKVYS